MEICIHYNNGIPKIWIGMPASGEVAFGSLFKGWQTRNVPSGKIRSTLQEKIRNGYVQIGSVAESDGPRVFPLFQRAIADRTVPSDSEAERIYNRVKAFLAMNGLHDPLPTAALPPAGPVFPSPRSPGPAISLKINLPSTHSGASWGW